MGWQEYNGGDEAHWIHLVLLFFILIGIIVIFWLFGPESEVPVNPTEEK